MGKRAKKLRSRLRTLEKHSELVKPLKTQLANAQEHIRKIEEELKHFHNADIAGFQVALRRMGSFPDRDRRQLAISYSPTIWRESYLMWSQGDVKPLGYMIERMLDDLIRKLRRDIVDDLTKDERVQLTDNLSRM